MSRHLLPPFLFSLCLFAFATGAAEARDWVVYPDGSGDAPTVAAAFDSAASSDTVVLGCGEYTEPAIELAFNPYHLRSMTREPECAVLHFRISIFEYGSLDIKGVTFGTGGNFGVDAEDDEGYPTGANIHGANCVFDEAILVLANSGWGVFTDCVFENGDHPIRGVDGGGTFRHCTIRNNSTDGNGGAARLLLYGDFTFEDCVFENNTATGRGGAVRNEHVRVQYERCAFRNNSAESDGGATSNLQSREAFIDCIFSGNSAGGNGGALALETPVNTHSSYTEGCTFWGNSADGLGGGIYYNDSVRHFYLFNTIVAGSVQGAGLYAADWAPSLSCTDIWGNAGGDWIGPIADSLPFHGNFSEDPRFCNASAGDFDLMPGSPCLDASGCGLVGSNAEGCIAIPTAVESHENAVTGLRLSAYPNPFRGETVLHGFPARQGPVTITVFDVAGRRVAERRIDGRERVTWDGTGGSGERVPPGVYFLRVRSEEREETTKVVLLR